MPDWRSGEPRNDSTLKCAGFVRDHGGAGSRVGGLRQNGTFGTVVESQREALEAIGHAASLASYRATIHEGA